MLTEGEHLRRVQYCPVERRVVAEHQRRQVELPIQGSLIHNVTEVLLDRLVGHFRLAVGLRVVGRRFEVVRPQLFKKLFR